MGRGGGGRALALGRRRCPGRLRSPALGRLGLGARSGALGALANCVRGGPGTLPRPARGRRGAGPRAAEGRGPRRRRRRARAPGGTDTCWAERGHEVAAELGGLNMAAVCVRPTGCVPGALQTTLQGGCCHRRVASEETEIQRSKVTCPRSRRTGTEPRNQTLGFQGSFFHYANTACISGRPEMVKNKTKYCCGVSPSPCAPFQPNLKVLKFYAFFFNHY